MDIEKFQKLVIKNKDIYTANKYNTLLERMSNKDKDFKKLMIGGTGVIKGWWDNIKDKITTGADETTQPSISHPSWSKLKEASAQPSSEQLALKNTKEFNLALKRIPQSSIDTEILECYHKIANFYKKKRLSIIGQYTQVDMFLIRLICISKFKSSDGDIIRILDNYMKMRNGLDIQKTPRSKHRQIIGIIFMLFCNGINDRFNITQIYNNINDFLNSLNKNETNIYTDYLESFIIYTNPIDSYIDFINKIIQLYEKQNEKSDYINTLIKALKKNVKLKKLKKNKDTIINMTLKNVIEILFAIYDEIMKGEKPIAM